MPIQNLGLKTLSTFLADVEAKSRNSAHSSEEMKAMSRTVALLPNRIYSDKVAASSSNFRELFEESAEGAFRSVQGRHASTIVKTNKGIVLRFFF